MHEVVRGKFFAFKGPAARRRALGFGRYTLIPSDYFDVFRVKNIRHVVRLNNKEYHSSALVQAGFSHHDLFFTDCSTPSDAIVDKFLRLSEEAEGALAVHCLAGLGRTGTLIAMYMMKHLGFSANEAMAWLRIVRPGSVIGPQQQYLRDQEQRMHRLGASGAPGLGGAMLAAAADDVAHSGARALDAGGGYSTSSQELEVLADMVSKGMLIRDQGRYNTSTGASHEEQGAAVRASNDLGTRLIATPASPAAQRGQPQQQPSHLNPKPSHHLHLISAHI